eukprot:gb/GECH01012038.1/.p1 GENE.gb/GECH01012038.1/~~gb/GECH01012038.1/.p1  ORF type:complete len:233 (+),score=59.16 gb/GECH01012038.1/:1-699(+)
MPLTIYWGSGSPFAWRGLLALEEKQAKYESKQLEMSKKEHKEEDYVKNVNPHGQVPGLTDDDGVVVWESLAILYYIDAKYPETAPLIPSDLKEKSKVYTLVHDFESSLATFKSLMKTIMGAQGDFSDPDTAAKVKDYYHQLKEMIQFVNDHIIQGEEFAVLDKLTMLDVCLYPFIAILNRMGFPIEQYPKIKTWFDNFSKRPSVEASYPPHWRDNPANTVLTKVEQFVKSQD